MNFDTFYALPAFRFDYANLKAELCICINTETDEILPYHFLFIHHFCFCTNKGFNFDVC